MRLLRKKQDYVVVSVGGSLIVPDAIDVSFLKKFRSLILDQIGRGISFYIITGGGKTCRRYNEAAEQAREGAPIEPDDLDRLGIQATRINANLLRTIFIEDAKSRIVKNPTKRLKGTDRIVISGGWEAGYSSDYTAVMAAKTVGAKKLVNLSNIDYVYTADPRTNPDAEKIEKISWSEFRKLIPSEWEPGLSSPFDPVAAREAEAIGLEVAVINGAKLDEFKNYIEGKPFVGTIIS